MPKTEVQLPKYIVTNEPVFTENVGAVKFHCPANGRDGGPVQAHQVHITSKDVRQTDLPPEPSELDTEIIVYRRCDDCRALTIRDRPADSIRFSAFAEPGGNIASGSCTSINDLNELIQVAINQALD